MSETTARIPPKRRQPLGQRGGRADDPGDWTVLRRASLERIARIARYSFAAPLVLIGLRGSAIEWCVDSHGLTMQERLHGQALCVAAQQHLDGAVLVVPDLARDARFPRSPVAGGRATFRFLACQA